MNVNEVSWNSNLTFVSVAALVSSGLPKAEL